MTSSLVMDVETSAQKRSNYLFRFESRELGRHARSGLWDSNRYPLRRYFSDVARNGFAGYQGAFQVAANGISRHLASVFKSLTVGADLGDGGDNDVEAAFRQRFE
jgi:hypothetical protein